MLLVLGALGLFKGCSVDAEPASEHPGWTYQAEHRAGASDTQGGFFSISQMLQPSLGPSSYLSCCSLLESMNCHVLTDTPGLRVTAWEGKASGLAHSSACPLGQEHHRDFTLYPHTTSKL